MSSEEILRRPSYGSNSRVVGARGAQTRRHILAVALQLFGERGFHDVAVDDLARAAGVSRATLYQYFESKDEIFAELLEECGGTLMRLIRRLGPLGPTLQGFDNLHWWLGEWAWVYDRYATMFAQWDHIETSDTAFRPMVTGFVDAYAGRIAERLTAAGFAGIEGVDTAAALLLVVHRFNYLRHSGRSSALTVDEMVDGMAVVLQLVLFPDTPPEVLASQGSRSAGLPASWTADVPSPRPGPDRFAGLRDRARATVRQLLDSAARTFAARGFAGSNLDAVAAGAGVARATLYKYFTDKHDVLAALAEEARDDVVSAAQRFGAIARSPHAGTELRRWLDDLVALSARHAGVLRVWVERQPDDPRVQELGEEVTRATRAAVAGALTSVQRPYPLDLHVAGLVLIAVLERIPTGLVQQSREVPRAEVVETMATFIERGLLAGTPASEAAAAS
ncbi:MAG: putative TetR-family transcriptional regulator [Frankiales bacterium]|nr:putative TetR-family transcriptional regulator [Frankiales bacterium]